MSWSYPYVLILAVIGVPASIILWAMLDAIVLEIIATEQWTAGGQEIDLGRERILWIWHYYPFWSITIAGLALLITGRRGR